MRTLSSSSLVLRRGSFSAVLRVELMAKLALLERIAYGKLASIALWTWSIVHGVHAARNARCIYAKFDDEPTAVVFMVASQRSCQHHVVD